MVKNIETVNDWLKKMLHDWLNMLLKQTFFTCHSLAKHDYISRASEAVFPLSLQTCLKVKSQPICLGCKSTNTRRQGETSQELKSESHYL